MSTFPGGKAIDFERLFAASLVQLFHFLDVRRFVECTAQPGFQLRKVRRRVALTPAAGITSPLLDTQTAT